METPLYCYLIKLSDKKDYTSSGEKIYIHTSNLEPTDENNNKIIIESYISSEFVRSYTFDWYINLSKITTYTQIDSIVKKNMLKYGILNVRGGSYYENVLPDYKMKTLEEELCNLRYCLDNKIPLYNRIMQNYDSDINLSEEDIKLRIEFNRLKQKEYESILSKYNTLRYIMFENDENITLTRDFSSELDFLKTHIDTFFNLLTQINDHITNEYDILSLLQTTTANEDNLRYCSIIRVLKKIPKLFIESKKMDYDEIEYSEISDTEFLKQYIEVASIPIVKNPGLQFDRFFNNWYINFLNNTFTNKKYMKNIKKDSYTVFHILERMFYTIINKADEYEYDLSTYNIFYESPQINEYQMKIDYYQHILSKRFTYLK